MGLTKLRSNSVGPYVFTIEAVLAPGKEVIKHSLRLSLNPVSATQVGTVSNKLRNEATRLRFPVEEAFLLGHLRYRRGAEHSQTKNRE